MLCESVFKELGFDSSRMKHGRSWVVVNCIGDEMNNLLPEVWRVRESMIP